MPKFMCVLCTLWGWGEQKQFVENLLGKWSVILWHQGAEKWVHILVCSSLTSPGQQLMCKPDGCLKITQSSAAWLLFTRKLHRLQLRFLFILSCFCDLNKSATSQLVHCKYIAAIRCETWHCYCLLFVCFTNCFHKRAPGRKCLEGVQFKTKSWTVLWLNSLSVA